MTKTFFEYFADVPDPRVDRTKRHDLSDILAITVCAVIAGADGWTDVALFGQCKYDGFKTFLKLPNGIPSHDTFGRVFAALAPDALERCFQAWMNGLAEGKTGDLRAVDGKTLRGSFDRAANTAAIQRVSVWAQENAVVLGQRRTDPTSNEIEAIPRLLGMMDLQDTTVTIDAMGCQKAIARQIRDQGGEYVLAVKANPGDLYEDVTRALDAAGEDPEAYLELPAVREVEKGHGRIETRTVWCLSDVTWLAERHDWPGLKSVAVVKAERIVGEKVEQERRYYISSLKNPTPQRMAEVIRGHWGIENRLHGSLDMSFNEDRCRIRQGHAAENFSRLRRAALNLLRQDQSVKVGVQAKRHKAGWDESYLLKILGI